MVVSVIFCAAPKRMNVLVHMMDDQEKFFRKEIISEFNKNHKVRLNVIRYTRIDSLEEYMKKYGGTLCLVKVPFDQSVTLMRKGWFKSLESFLERNEIDEFEDDYLLTTLGMVDNKPCLIPRKFETRILVYRKSKVANAVSVWRDHKNAINRELKKFNSFGLPSTYVLEEDPNAWDYFDIFVVGWIWAHTEYDGKQLPRIAHRGKRYSGTSLRLVDRVFQLDGDSNTVLSMKGDPVVDAFHWEAVYAAAGVFNERMWEENWSGVGVWEGFSDETVFLSFMTQLDCFFLHGTGRDNIDGYLKDPDDMGMAVMPSGCSLELDKNGIPVRTGDKGITTGGWWWGIPFDTPDPEVSFELATHITGTTNQIQECTRFGMIPVQKDILGDMSMMFGGGWITQIYETSFRQLMHNRHTVIPGNKFFNDIAALYLDAWYDIVVNKNWSEGDSAPDRHYIGERISNIYAEKASNILSGGDKGKETISILGLQ